MSFIYKTTGIYLGFISNGSIFSRDGEYLGWLEGIYAWDKDGRFRGQLWKERYIVLNRFVVPPVPKAPRVSIKPTALPDPPPNLSPIAVPTGWVDSF